MTHLNDGNTTKKKTFRFPIYPQPTDFTPIPASMTYAPPSSSSTIPNLNRLPSILPSASTKKFESVVLPKKHGNPSSSSSSSSTAAAAFLNEASSRFLDDINYNNYHVETEQHQCTLCQHVVLPHEAILLRPCLHGPLHSTCILAEEQLCVAVARVTTNRINKKQPQLHCPFCSAVVTSIAYNLTDEIPATRLPFSTLSMPSAPPMEENCSSNNHNNMMMPQNEQSDNTLRVDVHVIHHFPNDKIGAAAFMEQNLKHQITSSVHEKTSKHHHRTSKKDRHHQIDRAEKTRVSEHRRKTSSHRRR